MHYRVHGVGRKLGTEISATILAQSREEALRLAESTMIVQRIDEPEDPLDIPPASVNETPNVGAIQYASAAPTVPAPTYFGIVISSWFLRGSGCLCGVIGLWNIASTVDRPAIPYLFTAVMWISISALLFVISYVSLAVREIAMNSRSSKRDTDIPLAETPRLPG